MNFFFLNLVSMRWRDDFFLPSFDLWWRLKTTLEKLPPKGHIVASFDCPIKATLIWPSLKAFFSLVCKLNIMIFEDYLEGDL